VRPGRNPGSTPGRPALFAVNVVDAALAAALMKHLWFSGKIGHCHLFYETILPSPGFNSRRVHLLMLSLAFCLLSRLQCTEGANPERSTRLLNCHKLHIVVLKQCEKHSTLLNEKEEELLTYQRSRDTTHSQFRAGKKISLLRPYSSVAERSTRKLASLPATTC
jgi:hypothetical protein